MRRAVSKIIPTRGHRHGSSGGEDSTVSYKMDHHSVSEFSIQLEDPHKTWLPGEEVSGQIIFISKKNLANIVITLSLIGYVKVNASSHSKLRSMKHVLFNHTIQIYGDNLPEGSEDEGFQNGLYKGEHRFPFIVKLPHKRIFSSIDFGKGCIKYSLKGCIGDSSQLASKSPSSSSSTAESPGSTNMGSIISKKKNWKILSNPTYTTEQVIHLTNPIDVSQYSTPRQKKLILRDPRLSRKLSRTQSSASTINSTNTHCTASSNNSENADEISNQGTVTTKNGHSPGENVHLNSNNIKVCLEIPQGGYLRGELIPVKISVNHLRKIQDSNGIILTFVRVCRIDSGNDGAFESFRKDLHQAIIPLYVDPETFNAEVNTNVRVPPEAFPSISGCPLVSFQYFIEVLINLSGKSVVLDEGSKGTIGVDDSAHSGVYDKQMIAASNYDVKFGNSLNKTERTGYVNTDKYKRMKKFLQATTEVVIGTHRSSQGDSNKSVTSPSELQNESNPSMLPQSRRSSTSAHQDLNAPFSQTGSSSSQFSSHQSTPQIQPSNYRSAIPESHHLHDIETPPYTTESSVPSYDNIAFNNAVSNVPVIHNSNLSEKERVRAHEMSLLPSEPPLDESDENVDEERELSPRNELNNTETIDGIDMTPKNKSEVETPNQEKLSDEESSILLSAEAGIDSNSPMTHEESESVIQSPVHYDKDSTQHT